MLGFIKILLKTKYCLVLYQPYSTISTINVYTRFPSFFTVKFETLDTTFGFYGKTHYDSVLFQANLNQNDT